MVMFMGKIFAVALAVAAVLAVSAPADARGGCGIGWHRGPFGHCVRNEGAAVVVAPRVGVEVGVPGIGVFVTGRGYWDGHRYWRHRRHWRGGWRYY